MTKTVFSFFWGTMFALFLLTFILREVRTLLRKRSYSPWRGIVLREGIASAWLFALFRYGQVKPDTFIVAFLVSYFALVTIFARCFFKGVESYGRSA